MIKNTSNFFHAEQYHLTWVLVISLVLLIAFKLGLKMNIELENAILVIGILLGGVPHGAIDHIIQKKESLRTGHSFHLGVFYMAYLGVMGIYALFWLFLPIPSLVFFIVITAWHFGETDLFQVNFSHQIYRAIVYVFYGLWVILFLLISHLDSVEVILKSLPLQSVNGFLLLIQLNLKTIYWSFILFGLGIWIVQSLLNKRPEWFLLELLFFLILLSQIPLFIAFTLYFTGWHSLRSLHEIASFTGSKLNQRRFWLLTIPNTLLAILFLGILFLVWTKYYPLSSFILLVFILLSLLTLPHFIIMHRLYKFGENNLT